LQDSENDLRTLVHFHSAQPRAQFVGLEAPFLQGGLFGDAKKHMRIPWVNDGMEPVVRRWEEQRWMIDNAIRAVGIEFDQGRLACKALAIGPAGGRATP
jgi:hypothetical protein